MESQKVVTPVKTGVQMVCNYLKELDSGFRWNDGKLYFPTFYEFITLGTILIINIATIIHHDTFFINSSPAFLFMDDGRTLFNTIFITVSRFFFI